MEELSKQVARVMNMGSAADMEKLTPISVVNEMFAPCNAISQASLKANAKLRMRGSEDRVARVEWVKFEENIQARRMLRKGSDDAGCTAKANLLFAEGRVLVRITHEKGTETRWWPVAALQYKDRYYLLL